MVASPWGWPEEVAAGVSHPPGIRAHYCDRLSLRLQPAPGAHLGLEGPRISTEQLEEHLHPCSEPLHPHSMLCSPWG